MSNFLKSILNASKDGAQAISTNDQDPEPREFEPEPFTGIDIDTAAFSVQVQLGKAYHVTVSGKYKSYVKVRVTASQLVIREESHRSIIDSPEHFPRIVVTVPHGIQLEQVAINAAAGSLKLTQLDAARLTLELTAGSAVLDSVKVEHKSRIALEAGSLKISHSALTFDAEVAAGSAKIDTAGLRGSSSINLKSGSLTLFASPDVGFDLAAEIGSISYHSKRVGHRFSQKTDGTATLTAKAEVGSIKVK
ncbi:hypothetical protein EQ500_00575 [Lactobacillus sp. XV13L]|nr:hypothetical protein [Lactobacillus sp. XV13L]